MSLPPPPIAQPLEIQLATPRVLAQIPRALPSLNSDGPIEANGMDGVIIVDNDGMASAVWVEESASRLPEFLREAGFLEQQPAQSVSAG